MSTAANIKINSEETHHMLTSQNPENKSKPLIDLTVNYKNIPTIADLLVKANLNHKGFLFTLTTSNPTFYFKKSFSNAVKQIFITNLKTANGKNETTTKSKTSNRIQIAKEFQFSFGVTDPYCQKLFCSGFWFNNTFITNVWGLNVHIINNTGVCVDHGQIEPSEFGS